MKKYYGACNCKSVNFYCDGDPFFTQYCHCNKCREVAGFSARGEDKVGYSWTAGYLTASLHITSGDDNLEEIIRNNAKLVLCKLCRSFIYGVSLDPKKQGGIGVNVNNFVFDNLMPDSFKPVRHVWYLDRIVDFQDNLPKFEDAPKEQFGSGKVCDL